MSLSKAHDNQSSVFLDVPEAFDKTAIVEKLLETYNLDDKRSSSGSTIAHWKGYWGLGGVQGSDGRMSIPSVYISSRLYSSEDKNVLKNWDSVLVTDKVITGKINQGFDMLSYVPDDALLLIRNDSEVKIYSLTKDKNEVDLTVKNEEIETHWKLVEVRKLD